MTAPERKALIFLAAVALLGAGTRLVGAPRRADTPGSRAALARQLAAVDSARERRPPRARGREKGAGTARAREPRTRAPAAPAAPVDVDLADSAALDALPGVGPALARRIVEERARGGAFGSPAGLERVRGVGPRLAARLAPHVTFSGVPRPLSAAARRPP